MSAKDDAIKFLNQVLAGGPQPTPRVKQWAKNKGISERTLDRAKKDAGVMAERQGNNWQWRLADPTNDNTNTATPTLANPANLEQAMPNEIRHSQNQHGTGQELSALPDKKEPVASAAASPDICEPELSAAPDKPATHTVTIDDCWVDLVEVVSERRACSITEAANWLIEQGFLRRKEITEQKQQGDYYE